MKLSSVWDWVSGLFTGKKSKKAEHLTFYRVSFNKSQTVIFGEIKKMILTTTQEVDLAIMPRDKKGNPAQIDGIPVWSSGNPNFVTVTPAADGLSCVAKAVGVGSALIKVIADADLGAGTRNIEGTIQIDVVAAEADTLEIVPGVPREQP